jgi:hypothetical protein
MDRIQLGLASLAVFGLSISSAHAYLYEFSGAVPGPASIIDLPVSAGETWTALVNVDETVTDSQDTNSTSGLYQGAALEVNLAFSGGFTTSFSGSVSNEIRVWDNFVGPTTIDGIGVYMNDGINDLIIQVVNEPNLSSLTSDALPLPGTEVASDVAGTSYTMLTYSGALGGIAYSALSADNTVFKARASVPEPATLTLMGLGLVGLGFAHRKRIKKR